MKSVPEIAATATPLDAALAWAKRGRFVIPVRWGTKDGVPSGWPELRITSETAREYFNGAPSNIAVLPGPSGLADVDLDCVEAVRAAPHLLPATYVYGRERRPGSHMLFQCAPTKTRKWRDPLARASKATLIELRSEGAYSIIPPSIHPEGDQYRRESKHAAAETTPEALAAGCARVAAAALVARYWPQGSRHDAALALAGSLLHGGMAPNDVQAFCQAVIEAAADDELADRVRAVEDTLRDYGAGKRITGWPTLAEHLPAEVVVKVREWLAIEDFPALEVEDDAPKASGPRLLTRQGSKIERQPLAPLWPGVIWYRKLAVIVGDPDQGKTTVMCDIAARVTTGAPFPLHATEREPGNVLLLCAEDDADDTLVPRLEAAGADLSRIEFIDGIEGPKGSIDWIALDRHLGALLEHIRANGTRFVGIDPITAYLGRADSHKDSDVRRVLAGLAQIARQTEAAFLTLMHFNKGKDGPVHSRVMGSLAFTAAPRSVYGIGTDPDDDTRRLMVKVKCNLAKDTPGYGFSFEEHNGMPRLRWASEVETRTAQEVFQSSSAAGVHQLECEQCATLFVGSRADTKFCSSACRQKSYRQSVTGNPRQRSRNDPSHSRNALHIVTDVTAIPDGDYPLRHEGAPHDDESRAGQNSRSAVDVPRRNPLNAGEAAGPGTPESAGGNLRGSARRSAAGADLQSTAPLALAEPEYPYPCLNCGGKGCRICDAQIRAKGRMPDYDDDHSDIPF